MRRLIACLAACFALSGPVAALDLSSMTPQERAAFGEAVKDYLLENPQVIMDAVAVLEQRQADAQAQADVTLVETYKQALFNDGTSFVGGNPEGDITLVEFLDYRCGYCKRAHPEVAKLLAADGNIKLIVKEFPILGDQSVLASRFAIATRQQAGADAYKALSDALMSFNGQITMPALARMANSLGLDATAIEAGMNDASVSNELRQNRALAEALQIRGTPSFVLQDEILRGFLPHDQMLKIVEDKRS